MEYAQLNEAGTDAIQITSHGDIEWDANNFCSADALTRDGKAEQFRVVPLLVTEPPEIDPLTHTVIRDGCEQVDGAWQYKWRIDALTPEQIEAAYRATIPVAVTMRQARLALLGAGVLATADAAIASMTGIEGDAARIEWEYAHEVRRDAALVAGMAAALSLTDGQLDALFVTAAGL